ncbi:DUF349 domain-containing protein [Croceiramulus getboli]|nr:DUF349 domain-containing protein [Flavobacteriaceae bacterium YJPT1-3]
MSEEKNPESNSTNPSEKPKNTEQNTATEEAIIAEANKATLPSVADIEEEIQSLDALEDEDTDAEDSPKDLDDELNEDSEDESSSERHEIPKKEYDSLSKQELIDEFKYLLKNHKIQAIKEHVDEIRAAFYTLSDEALEEVKERFLADGGNIIDFRYTSPELKEFSALYFDYREKRNQYYRNLKKNLQANLETRNALIEELKELKNEVGGEDGFNAIYAKFKDIQERWRNAGNIPRDRYNLVWNTYHHHVENFYDFLHLNREFRDRDFKENLDKKLKLIERAEELIQESDVMRAFRELQMLHKIWKEEVGPVAKEYREDIWEQFSEATKKIHDARQEYFKNIDEIQEQNFLRKQAIISEIATLALGEYKSHKAWQEKIKEVQGLRDEFFKAGKVPRKKNKEIWNAFKEATRSFNRQKNGFYKEQKKEQFENLKKKQELVRIAEQHKDSEDFKATTDLMKKIQQDWKKIGHVPRKDSDKVWKAFKAACNHYFDRLHASKNKESAHEIEAFQAKNVILEKVRKLKLEGSREDNLKTLKEHISAWKALGRVPFKKKNIEKDFNKALDVHFKQLDVNRKEAELIKYDNRMSNLVDADDQDRINRERFFLKKKIEEVKGEIRQLENNLGFFQHVPDDNPMVKEVHQNIKKHREELELWKAKLRKLKSIDA